MLLCARKERLLISLDSLQTLPAAMPASVEPAPTTSPSAEPTSITPPSAEPTPVKPAESVVGKPTPSKAAAIVIAPPHESPGLGDVPLVVDDGVAVVGGITAVGIVLAIVRVTVVANRCSAVVTVVEILVAARVCVVETEVVVERGEGESASRTLVHINLVRARLILGRSGGNDFKDTGEGDGDKDEEDKDFGHVEKAAERIAERLLKGC